MQGWFSLNKNRYAKPLPTRRFHEECAQRKSVNSSLLYELIKAYGHA